jgi:hypothetical protein
MGVVVRERRAVLEEMRAAGAEVSGEEKRARVVVGRRRSGKRSLEAIFAVLLL